MGLKQAIVVRTDLGMGKGKIAAQASHASVAALDKVTTSAFNAWQEAGMKKIVLKVSGKKELLDLYQSAKQKLPAALVKDAGMTQVKPEEPTCIAIGPADEKEIDKLTGNLKLL
ncbi:MAG: peptidyl-tRNA hydrolase [Candidatus Diapherotrites archaeon]|uniref:Peptidyl-tRNA hydrolase n=1 Tax=Candidatus Iainarchaeum sp. TaxID=3101447 RepID=A0A938YXT4_9ARCH|nr:peptidyl-tRNA hydrolase [Candidatus Diapherotrites archaeon]